MKISRISWPFWLLLLGFFISFLSLATSQYFYRDHRWVSVSLVIAGVSSLYVASITMIIRQIKTSIRWIKKADTRRARHLRAAGLTITGLLVAPFLIYYWFVQLGMLPIFFLRA